MIVHQFAPQPPGERPVGDRRNWTAALANNDQALASFVGALTAAGPALSHPTEFVPAGIELRVRKALAPLAPPIATAACEDPATA